MSSRTRDLLSATLVSAGIVGAGELHGVYDSTASASAARDYWADWFDADRWHPTVSTGYAQITSGRNDVLLLMQGTHNLASMLTWSASGTHMVGMSGIGDFQPVELAQSANFAIAMTVSGFNNTFSNFRWTHGRGSATNVTAVQVTGKGNSWRKVHFHGPMNATEAGTDAYRLVRLARRYNYFEDCTFGSMENPFSNAAPATPYTHQTLLHFDKSTEQTSTFKNCRFNLATDNSNPHFMSFEYQIASPTYITFQNCSFLNVSTTSLLVGIGPGQGNGGWLNTSDCKVYFDSNSCMAGCTDAAPADGEGFFLWANTAPSTGTAIHTGMGISHDHTE